MRAEGWLSGNEYYTYLQYCIQPLDGATTNTLGLKGKQMYKHVSKKSIFLKSMLKRFLWPLCHRFKSFLSPPKKNHVSVAPYKRQINYL